jgi:hypothetical protein
MLTNPESTWCSKELGIKKDGVMLLITDNNNNLLIIKEKTDKASTFKVKGEIGVVCETRDNPFESNNELISRGIKEELGIKKDEFKRIFDTNTSYLGTYLFVNQVLAHVYKLKCIDPVGLEEKIRSNSDGEIDFVGWRKIDYLVKPQNGDKVRLGVQNVIKSIPETTGI